MRPTRYSRPCGCIARSFRYNPKYEEQNFHPASHSFCLRHHRFGGAFLMRCERMRRKQKRPRPSASAESGTKDSFDLADANHDGKLSREEAGDYLVYVVFAFS